VSGGSIVKIVGLRDPHVPILNSVARDNRLSLRARGLLVYLLSLPPDWVVRQSHLARDTNTGRDALRTLFLELRHAGYARYERLRDVSTGNWQGAGYKIFPTPEEALATAPGEAADDEADETDQDIDSGSASDNDPIDDRREAVSAPASHAKIVDAGERPVSPECGFSGSGGKTDLPGPVKAEALYKGKTLTNRPPLTPKIEPMAMASAPDLRADRGGTEKGTGEGTATRSAEPSIDDLRITREWKAFSAAWEWAGEDFDRARKRFERLNDADRARAIEVAPRVAQWSKTNSRPKPMAANFLRRRLFEQDYTLPPPRIFVREGTEWAAAWLDWWRRQPGAPPGRTGSKTILKSGEIVWGSPLYFWEEIDGRKVRGRWESAQFPPRGDASDDAAA
jgi:hypothetical protein